MPRMKIPVSPRYRKRVGAFSALDVKRDESVLALSAAAECYNFDFSSGALRAGYGVIESEFVPSAAERYFVYKYYSETAGGYVDQYVYQIADGRLYMYDCEMDETLLISRTKYPPVTALNYRLDSKDVLLLSCEGKKLVTWDGKVLTEHESPTVSSMALHYERLFVTSRDDPTKVFFSDDFDPTDWSISAGGGGFIELLDERGYANKVISFGNYLYVFREHGISRITAFGDQKEFSAINLFVTAGRIYPESIAACGSVIVFAASDGMYVFDGYEAARVLNNLDGLLLTDESVCGAYFNGKYFLACGMRFKDGLSERGLLVYDPRNAEYSVSRGLDISFMSACVFEGSDFLMCCSGGSGGVVERCGKEWQTPLAMHWQSPETDLGKPDENKILRELYVKTDTEITVTLRSGKKKKTVTVKPNKPRVRVNFGAPSFTLEIDSTGSSSVNIAAPTLIYSVG